jgi:hypothetical protein
MGMNRLCAFPRNKLQTPGTDWGMPGLAHDRQDEQFGPIGDIQVCKVETDSPTVASGCGDWPGTRAYMSKSVWMSDMGCSRLSRLLCSAKGVGASAAAL